MKWQPSGAFGTCCRSRRRCSSKRRKSVLRPIAQSAHNATRIPAPMILDALHRIADCRESLSREEARAVRAEILSGKCTDAQIAALLGALHVNGEPLEEIVGLGFLFAPAMHSAMTFVQRARRELKIRTIFNLLGPLTNPAQASGQVVGVYSLDLVEKVAEALSMLGLHRGFVVHGLDGLDEITLTGPTRVAEIHDGTVRSYEITPEEFGITRATLDDISGGDSAANAILIRKLLGGDKSPRRNVVLLNAAAALVAAGRAEHIGDALPMAAQSLDSGAAAHKLEALVRFTAEG